MTITRNHRTTHAQSSRDLGFASTHRRRRDAHIRCASRDRAPRGCAPAGSHIRIQVTPTPHLRSVGSHPRGRRCAIGQPRIPIQDGPYAHLAFANAHRRPGISAFTHRWIRIRDSPTPSFPSVISHSGRPNSLVMVIVFAIWPPAYPHPALPSGDPRPRVSRLLDIESASHSPRDTQMSRDRHQDWLLCIRDSGSAELALGRRAREVSRLYSADGRRSGTLPAARGRGRSTCKKTFR